MVKSELRSTCECVCVCVYDVSRIAFINGKVLASSPTGNSLITFDIPSCHFRCHFLVENNNELSSPDVSWKYGQQIEWLPEAKLSAELLLPLCTQIATLGICPFLKRRTNPLWSHSLSNTVLNLRDRDSAAASSHRLCESAGRCGGALGLLWECRQEAIREEWVEMVSKET